MKKDLGLSNRDLIISGKLLIGQDQLKGFREVSVKFLKDYLYPSQPEKAMIIAKNAKKKTVERFDWTFLVFNLKLQLISSTNFNTKTINKKNSNSPLRQSLNAVAKLNEELREHQEGN
ncbi:hypothetical protein BY996DRAFT_6444053 [Phakopsora pachyrhizi]|nr:hypothetical protein BY996DRAFT_6444053 [Phakopsora pachyrhizi]